MLGDGRTFMGGLAGSRYATLMFMNIARSMLIENSNGGVSMDFIHGHCHDSMAGCEASIVGVILRGIARLLAEQPAPKAAFALWLARPVVGVLGILLRVALYY